MKKFLLVLFAIAAGFYSNAQYCTFWPQLNQPHLVHVLQIHGLGLDL